MSVTREEAKKILLASLLDGPKVLHMGRCPVDAIALAFEMSGEKLVRIFADEISITEKGREFLK